MNKDTLYVKRKRPTDMLLLVSRIGADHANDAVATNDLAIAADLLDRRLYSHVFPFNSKRSLGAEHNARA